MVVKNRKVIIKIIIKIMAGKNSLRLKLKGRLQVKEYEAMKK